MKKQTAGRDELEEFAPQFAALNDDVLFGEVWARENILSLKVRSIITITALISKGIIDSSLSYHLKNALDNGVSKQEIVEILTQLAFYAGWPNVWPAMRMAKEIYADDKDDFEQKGGMFGLGEPNDTYAKYFVGNSYLKPLTTKNQSVNVANVTFEPECRNNWHIHKAKTGGGQILLCVQGYGWYQEEGKPARKLKEGDVVLIPANIKHWHGAQKDSWFSHLAIECPGEETQTEWLEEVNEQEYNKLK